MKDVVTVGFWLVLVFGGGFAIGAAHGERTETARVHRAMDAAAEQFERLKASCLDLSNAAAIVVEDGERMHRELLECLGELAVRPDCAEAKATAGGAWRGRGQGL